MSRLELKVTLQPGDLLLSRHLDETLNITPGYFNHVAIYVGNNEIVHAIREKGVVLTPYAEYFEGCGKIKLVRLQIGPTHRKKMSDEARNYVGIRYRTLQSLFFHLFKQSFNCTGLARRCYKTVMKKDPKWIIPDHVLESKGYIHCNLK